MQRSLLRHPASPPSPVRQVMVDAVRLADGRVSFVYGAVGDLGRVRVPAEGEPERADGLWRRTCFEAFLRPAGSESYFELNFAPSRQWAAYAFDRYRCAPAALALDPPEFAVARDSASLGLVASVALGPVPELVPWESWEIALAAVIEAEDGGLSHWALAHPRPEPDFHHRGGFAARLEPAASL